MYCGTKCMLSFKNGGIGSIVRNTGKERSRKNNKSWKSISVVLYFCLKKKEAWMSQPPSPVLLPITPLSGYFHYMYTGFLCISLIILTSPVFWVFHFKPAFSFTTLCKVLSLLSGILGPSHSDSSTLILSLYSVPLWKHRSKIYNSIIPTLLHFSCLKIIQKKCY